MARDDSRENSLGAGAFPVGLRGYPNVGNRA